MICIINNMYFSIYLGIHLYNFIPQNTFDWEYIHYNYVYNSIN